jgi:hypothetical protein
MPEWCILSLRVLSLSQVLKKALEDKLREYNEANAVMDLVLFQQAMEHITRIARIIDLPRGNAMLVGVGGSGKQSLARLASFICGYEVFQISVSSTYGVNEFKENLLSLYRKAGTKGTPITFLMTGGWLLSEPAWKITVTTTSLVDGNRNFLRKSSHLRSLRGSIQAHVLSLADALLLPWLVVDCPCRQPDREGGVPCVHQRPSVHRLHRRPVHR